MSDKFIITEEQVGQALENAISLPKMHDLMEIVLARPLLEAIAEHNAGAIVELERRAIKCGLHEDYNKAETYNKAIALIKNGVEKHPTMCGFGGQITSPPSAPGGGLTGQMEL